MVSAGPTPVRVPHNCSPLRDAIDAEGVAEQGVVAEEQDRRVEGLEVGHGDTHFEVRGSDARGIAVVGPGEEVASAGRLEQIAVGELESQAAEVDLAVRGAGADAEIAGSRYPSAVEGGGEAQVRADDVDGVLGGGSKGHDVEAVDEELQGHRGRAQGGLGGRRGGGGGGGARGAWWWWQPPWWWWWRSCWWPRWWEPPSWSDRTASRCRPRTPPAHSRSSGSATPVGTSS